MRIADNIYKIILVPKEQVPALWVQYEDYLKSSIRTMNVGIEDYYKLCNTGKGRLWGFYENLVPVGAMITNIQPFPKMSVLQYLLVGTTRQHFHPFLPVIDKTMTEYGRANNCKAIEFGGRKGWIKLFEDYGFVPDYYAMRKEIL